MSDTGPLVDLFSAAGFQPPPLAEAAHLVAYGHTLASLKSLPGIRIEAAATPDGLVAEILVDAGVRAGPPLHLCLGLHRNLALQNVRLTITLQPDAEITVLSHCLFSTPQAARHAMDADIHLMEGAILHHQEAHHHGLSGSIEVLPHARVMLDRGARYLADFSLVQGRVGWLDIDYTVAVGEDALAELVSRVYGWGSDRIRLVERLSLDGAGARGLVKSRVAVRDDAQSEVRGVMAGNAAGARGHVDCMEIVRDRATACAVPEVRVRHPLAKVTHEAAIGSVDSHQLETLMARGLAPDAAVDLIVRGMLA